MIVRCIWTVSIFVHESLKPNNYEEISNICSHAVGYHLADSTRKNGG